MITVSISTPGAHISTTGYRRRKRLESDVRLPALHPALRHVRCQRVHLALLLAQALAAGLAENGADLHAHHHQQHAALARHLFGGGATRRCTRRIMTMASASAERAAGTAAARSCISHWGKRVRFFSTADLVNALEQEKAAGMLAESPWGCCACI